MTAQQRYQQAITLFIGSQLCLLLPLILCVLLLPSGMLANRGFSYFGDYPRTRLLYQLAFVSAGCLLLLSAFRLPWVMPVRVLKVGFMIMVPLLFGVLVTTSPDNRALDGIHITIGVTLFVLQFILGSWLAVVICRDTRTMRLWLLLIAGGVLAVLALVHLIPVLLWGQVCFQTAFAVLLIQALRKLQAGL